MLNGQVVVITGGTGLIGNEFVQAVVNHGGTAIVADIDETAGRALIEHEQKEIENGGKVDYVRLDINSIDSVDVLINSVSKKYKKIDALVNCAYPRNENYGRRFEEVTYEDFCENVNLHLGGYFLVIQKMAEYFAKQGFGNIVNIASIYGVIAPRFEIYEGTEMTMPVEYAVIKSALIHLTKYVAKYYKGKNIRINSISPGGILDNQPRRFIEQYKRYGLTKGMLNVEDLVGTLVFLLSPQSKYINGQNIVVDDGFIQ